MKKAFIILASLVVLTSAVWSEAAPFLSPEGTILAAFNATDRKEAYQYFALKKYLWEMTKGDYLGVFRNPFTIYRIYIPKKPTAYFFARFNYEVMRFRKMNGTPRVAAMGLVGKSALVEVVIDVPNAAPVKCQFEMFQEFDGWKILKVDGVPKL